MNIYRLIVRYKKNKALTFITQKVANIIYDKNIQIYTNYMVTKKVNMLSVCQVIGEYFLNLLTVMTSSLIMMIIIKR